MGTFAECRQASVARAPAEHGIAARRLPGFCCPRLKTEAGDRDPAVKRLQSPTKFKMYWANMVYGKYYAYHFFVVPDNGGWLCWLTEKQCKKIDCESLSKRLASGSRPENG